MKVFISWSGARSKALATSLRDWLRLVIQAVDPFTSQHDIDKGSRWATELGEALEATNVGLLCVTPENLKAPWLMYEAGALSKRLNGSRVVPILFGLEPSDVEWPLAQFQSASFTRDDMLRVAGEINDALNERALAQDILLRAFNQNWEEFNATIGKILESASPLAPEPKRTERALLEELLGLVRGLARSEDATAIKPPAPRLWNSLRIAVKRSAVSRATLLALRRLVGDSAEISFGSGYLTVSAPPGETIDGTGILRLLNEAGVHSNQTTLSGSISIGEPPQGSEPSGV